MRRDAEGAMEPRSPGGAAEGEDNGVSGCCAPCLGFRSPGGGCGCAFTAFTCRPGTSDGTASPLSGALGGCQRSAHSNR